MKLYFADLPCYQNLTVDERSHKLYSPEHAFDLQKLPNETLRTDFAAFIIDRASSLYYLSLRSEQTHFHNLAKFLSEYYPEIQHITDIPLEELEKKMKMHLMKKGQNITCSYKKADRRGGYRRENPNISYLKTVYAYFLPNDDAGFNKENDIWRRETIPFSLRASPIGTETQINFSRIKQAQIKAEIKEAALYHLKRLAFRTVLQEVSAINFLSEFLYKNFPEIDSLKDFDRPLLEEYLSYTYLECGRRKDYRGELSSLKSVLNITGKLFSYDNLRGIFLKTDFQKHKRTIYKSYSDAELERLHAAYKLLDKQTARLLLIHEMLGLRISDTLTLKAEDVLLSDDPHIKIAQPKTNNSYQKKISPELAALLQASIEETRTAYGDTPYIFVAEKNPREPMKYSTLHYRLTTLIYTLDLRDDNGNLFTAGTHLFRHTYGKKLCDLLNDDATIAALLGHKSITSVAYYRQMSPKVLAKETKPVIDKRNEKIKQFKKGWME